MPATQERTVRWAALLLAIPGELSRTELFPNFREGLAEYAAPDTLARLHSRHLHYCSIGSVSLVGRSFYMCTATGSLNNIKRGYQS